MSDGLIPLIRPAWPSERGRTRSNFSRASARSWGIGAVVEVGGDGLVLQTAESLDLVELAVDVAVVLGLDRDLLDRRRRRSHGRARPGSRASSVVPGRRRAPQDLVQRVALDAAVGQDACAVVDRIAAGLEPAPAMVVDQADLLGPAR